MKIPNPEQMDANPQLARLAMRRRAWTGSTVNRLPGFIQCNLVVLPQREAYDFLLYCQRNPQACPVIEVTDTGCAEPKWSAPGADLRTDLPRYVHFRNGKKETERNQVAELWRDDLVAFLLGSSLSFDLALERAGVPPSQDVWVLRTKVATRRAGRFQSLLVVTMRWMTAAQAIIASQLTSRFPYSHGAPVHIGDPSEIGADLEYPLAGRPVGKIPKGMVPVFWACGVTAQEAALASRIEFMITHAPGHGFITDLLADQWCIP